MEVELGKFQAEYVKLQLATMESDLKPSPKGAINTFLNALFKCDPFELQPELKIEHKVGVGI
jgi:hypothetical protein